MQARRVWSLFKWTNIPKGRRPVKNKWIFDIKRDGRFKARMVAFGYSQVGGVDFTQVFSPVVNDVTFRIMLLAKMIWKLQSYLFDVETAFLLGDLEEKIYMDCPQGIECQPDDCVLLHKSIYGLVQSARQFNKFWNKLMTKLGFKVSPADPCLFSRGTGSNMLLICLYVADGFACGKEQTLQKFFEEIKQEKLAITIEKSMGDYLSCEVKFNAEMTKAWLGQPHLIKKLEKVFGEEVAGVKQFKTPGTPNFGIIRPTSEDQKCNPELQTRYRSGVGMLLYLVKHSRPDIANTVRELTKCMDGCTPAAYKEMLRLIKFVLDSKTLGLKLQPKAFEESTFKWNLVMFSDSDWAGDKENRRSISGFIMFLCGVPIVWRSKQQTTVALSSSEAEFIAISDAVKEILFVLQILNSVGIQVHQPVIVRVDNMGAIFMSENSTSSVRTRHIDTRYHFVRELVEGKIIEIVFVKTAENLADGFTKNVNGDTYDAHSPEFVIAKEEIGSLAVGIIPAWGVLNFSILGTGTHPPAVLCSYASLFSPDGTAGLMCPGSDGVTSCTSMDPSILEMQDLALTSNSRPDHRTSSSEDSTSNKHF